ncbi:Peptidase M8, partial [Trypanosoma melophagium]|uniref:Peptidase M8 n=1 Tax=Trypanosoma melophagium TaxID=715481 RepID=UPI00351A06B6
MDGDPIIRPLVGTACEGGDETLLPGSLFGRESRCLSAKDLVLRDPKGQKKPNIAGVCAKVKCGNDKTVSVQLKGYEQNDKQWHECSGDKATVELDGSVFSNGTIECPKYEEVCTGLPKTETLTVKFYTGAEVRDTHEVLNDKPTEERAEETAKSQQIAHKPDPATAVTTKHVQELPSAPKIMEGNDPVVIRDDSLTRPGSETYHHNALAAVSPGSGSESSDASNLKENEVVSGSGSISSRNQPTDLQQLHDQASVHVVGNTVSTQNSLHPASPAAVPAISSTAVSNNIEQEISKDKREPFTHNPESLDSHLKRDESASGISPQRADSPTEESRVQQDEKQTIPESQDHHSNSRQTQIQVESQNELKPSTKDSTPQTEVSSASSSSINVPATAASPSPEESFIPTKVAQTVKTAQPKKDESSNNTPPSTTSSSTEVNERTNASIAEKEPINEDKNKGSAANQMEHLANQLGTVGEKNADSSSITTSYIGGCLVAFLVC